ncbi:MAG: leucine--tRNA ligase [Aigarchaeota archaeon]|nr:leucine--tRNA ligase [Aigarchaeota archaeon]MDW8093302.1 leucine--tRNA ligase [Nitrososphaerota archaeon]
MGSFDYEMKWAKVWSELRVYEADPDPDREKFFITFPYSYQNGPLHVGHGFTATRADVIARFYRMMGYNVLFPWAWHWTGEAVAGLSDRLKRGDSAVIKMLTEVDKVDESMLEKFTDPAFICSYYTKENREVVKAMGFSVDWRREFYTTDLHPYYSKFIEWQYVTLEKLGRVKRGSHPVVWCPSCKSPTGDHDRLIGEGVSPTEFTLVLFRCGNLYLAAATLRPETIFGTTNVWVNPNATYVSIVTGGREIVVSKEAALKLVEQMSDISIGGEIKGRSLIGQVCEVPITGERVIVLPARFVNPLVGSGVVYSVPSHAPYDYAALKELKAKGVGEPLDHSLDEIVARIQPISIISVRGAHQHPAVWKVEEAGIVSQDDERLEDLTKEVYALEFYNGTMRENCGEFANLPVPKARDSVKMRLTDTGRALVMYDLTERVVCRSGDECIVKVVRDQWFLNYSDAQWKNETKGLVMEMDIYPESARQWFLNVIDWLRDWPCARKTGLGTRLPFDKDWIVETLSDSTVYQALYTIAHRLNDSSIKPENLKTEFFDYVFRGVGDPGDVSRITGVDVKTLEELRSEFTYWYPLNLRISAKELVSNHLTFFIFQHVALFDPKFWPRGIGVNGMVQVEGAKMSKSKGNFVTLKSALRDYGADGTRLNLLLAAEDMDDPDWRSKNAEEMAEFVSNFLRTISEYKDCEIESNWTLVDRWLMSRLRLNLRGISDNLKKLKTRSATAIVTYTMMNDWRWYVRRRLRPGPASRHYIDSWVKVMSIFAPFVAEEAWSILGNEGLVIAQHWPSLDGIEYDEVPLLAEELVGRLLSDVKNVIEVTGRQIQRLYIYPSPPEYLRLVDHVLEIGVFEVIRRPSEVIRFAISSLGVEGRSAHKLVQRLTEILEVLTHRYQKQTLLRVAEIEPEIYNETRSFLSRELDAEVIVSAEDVDPMGKSLQALPFKPGIYVEWKSS